MSMTSSWRYNCTVMDKIHNPLLVWCPVYFGPLLGGPWEETIGGLPSQRASNVSTNSTDNAMSCTLPTNVCVHIILCYCTLGKLHLPASTTAVMASMCQSPDIKRRLSVSKFGNFRPWSYEFLHHGGVVAWKNFPYYWPFARGIYWSWRASNTEMIEQRKYVLISPQIKG